MSLPTLSRLAMFKNFKMNNLNWTCIFQKQHYSHQIISEAISSVPQDSQQDSLEGGKKSLLIQGSPQATLEDGNKSQETQVDIAGGGEKSLVPQDFEFVLPPEFTCGYTHTPTHGKAEDEVKELIALYKQKPTLSNAKFLLKKFFQLDSNKYIDNFNEKYFKELELEAEGDKKYLMFRFPKNDNFLIHLDLSIVPNEAPVEREFRLQATEIKDWNEKYWQDHEEEFQHKKLKFIIWHLRLMKKIGNDRDTLTPEDMSYFYMKFIKENEFKHQNHHWKWLIKNAKLIWPALKVYAYRVVKRYKELED